MSRMQSELNKLLKVRDAVERAITAETAMSWLNQYGPKDDVGKDSISASVSQNYAAGCTGAKEAKHYLEEAIQQCFGEIGRRASQLAKSDIDAASSALSPHDAKGGAV